MSIAKSVILIKLNWIELLMRQRGRKKNESRGGDSVGGGEEARRNEDIGRRGRREVDGVKMGVMEGNDVVERSREGNVRRHEQKRRG